jgi:hypothetical protein
MGKRKGRPSAPFPTVTPRRGSCFATDLEAIGFSQLIRLLQGLFLGEVFGFGLVLFVRFLADRIALFDELRLPLPRPSGGTG